MMSPHPGIEPGERLVDFTARTPDGLPWQLYDRVMGVPVALWIAREPAGSRLGAALPSLTANWPELHSLALRQGSPEANAQFARDTGFGGVMLSDHRELGESLAPGPGDALLLFDANLRLLAQWRCVPPLEWLLDTRAALIDGCTSGAGNSRWVTRQAPVLLVPRVLDAAECRRLIALYESEGGTPSGMPAWNDGQQSLHLDLHAKRRHDVRIVDPEINEWLALLLARRLLPELHRAFAWEPRGYENFKLVCYGVDGPGYFRLHRDNLAPQAAHRKFAITVNLNTDDYEGGALRFPEYGDTHYAPPTGGALVFSGALAHEVTDVTAGRRYALLSFLFD